jgi:hypothetical protein
MTARNARARQDMTTGEAEAWRQGWEAAREGAAERVCAALPDWRDRIAFADVIEAQAAAIRAMEPPKETKG